MRVDNDILIDARRTQTRQEPKATIKKCSQKTKEKKGRLERREPSAKKHCLPKGFPKNEIPNNNPRLRNSTLNPKPIQ
jgi:hypothetical protein